MEVNAERGLDVSVVVPVLNEADNLPRLVSRVAETLHATSWTWELICVLDGCTDDSLEVLLEVRQREPAVRVLDLAHGVGQHPALAAGFERARGRFVVTLDADLQNPPEAIPDIVRRLAEGAEAVGTLRRNRRDPAHRAAASKLFAGALRALGVRHVMGDPGCMLRGWRAQVVTAFLASGEPALYLPTQLNRHAATYEEFATPHAARAAGESRYGAWRLARLFGRTVVAELAPRRARPANIRVAGWYRGEEA